MRRFTTLTIITTTLLLTLTGCDSWKSKNDEPLPAGSLTRNLTLIGNDGKRYGTVELNPVSGGRMYDTQGQLIGTVITPAQ